KDLLGVARAAAAHGRADENSLRRLLSRLQGDGGATELYRFPVGPALPGAPTEILGPIEDYQITKVIGYGAMGVVLEASDPARGRRVAIKVLSPALASDLNARERFAREGRAAGAVRHEHVVTIHAVREAGGVPFLVMEYLAGGSLQQYLERSGPPG